MSDLSVMVVGCGDVGGRLARQMLAKGWQVTGLRRSVGQLPAGVQPVAADLAADAGTMANLSARPEVYALATRLADVGAAIRAGDWAAAEASWTLFKTEAASIEERAF